MTAFDFRREIMRRRPFRWLWRLRAAIILHRFFPYNERGEPNGWQSNWQYSETLASYLDDECDDYLSPADAIDEDRQYWGGVDCG